MCGEISDGDGVISGGASQCAVPSQCTVAAGCAPVPPPSANQINIPAINPWEASYMNFFQRTSNECYFFFGQNGVGYFWDGNRTALGGQSCNAFPQTATSLTPRPCGMGSADVADGVYDGIQDPWCHCWVPVYYDNGGGHVATPDNPYRSGGPLAAAAPNAGLVTQDGCSGGRDCTALEQWTPQFTGAAAVVSSYNFAALCNDFTPAGTPLWDTTQGTTASITTAAADSDVPDAIFFMDGPPGGVVEINAAFSATMAIVTPMRVRVSSTASLRRPQWTRTCLLYTSPSPRD